MEKFIASGSGSPIRNVARINEVIEVVGGKRKNLVTVKLETDAKRQRETTTTVRQNVRTHTNTLVSNELKPNIVPILPNNYTFGSMATFSSSSIAAFKQPKVEKVSSIRDDFVQQNGGNQYYEDMASGILIRKEYTNKGTTSKTANDINGEYDGANAQPRYNLRPRRYEPTVSAAPVSRATRTVHQTNIGGISGSTVYGYGNLESSTRSNLYPYNSVHALTYQNDNIAGNSINAANNAAMIRSAMDAPYYGSSKPMVTSATTVGNRMPAAAQSARNALTINESNQTSAPRQMNYYTAKPLTTYTYGANSGTNAQYNRWSAGTDSSNRTISAATASYATRTVPQSNTGVMSGSTVYVPRGPVNNAQALGNNLQSPTGLYFDRYDKYNTLTYQDVSANALVNKAYSNTAARVVNSNNTVLRPAILLNSYSTAEQSLNKLNIATRRPEVALKDLGSSNSFAQIAAPPPPIGVNTVIRNPNASSSMATNNVSGNQFREYPYAIHPTPQIFENVGLATRNTVGSAATNVSAVKKRGTRLSLSSHYLQDYAELQVLESGAGTVSNLEAFECGICFTFIEPLGGIVLRNCLHNFCKDCIIQLINLSEDVNVKCPYTEDDYKCTEELQDREIRDLLSDEQFDKYLKKTINFAEQNTTNSFHCKLPNCPGWCECDENVNTFHCPVCHSINCINCAAIHAGKNCREYQDDLSMNDNDKKSKASIDKMINDGDAMRCPKCQIIIVKREGCDALLCVMCRTEICWATKGFRWGPKGIGDISGGCRCRVNNKRCHPTCRNCH